MSKLQIALIAALMVTLLAVAILFWGSIASAMCVVGLFLIPSTLAYKKIWGQRNNDDFDDLDPYNLLYQKHLDQMGTDSGDE